MTKFDVFTGSKYDIRIKWITKIVKQLFKLKSRNLRPSYVIKKVYALVKSHTLVRM